MKCTKLYLTMSIATTSLALAFFSSSVVAGNCAQYKSKGLMTEFNHPPVMTYTNTHYRYHPVMKNYYVVAKNEYAYSNYDKPKIYKASYHGTAKQRDIVDTAISAGGFDTLLTAIKEADLVSTLKGDGPYTVFAPTDEAFAKIPKEQLDALLADKEALTDVLTYHVVPGKVLAKDVVKLNKAKTVQGQEISIDSTDGVKVDGANVIKTDIMTSNGVIHVIDNVILPADS